MPIVRYQDSSGTTGYGFEGVDGTVLKVTGDPIDYRLTSEPVVVARRLAPIQPTAIYCIGQNYRLHNAETHASEPEHPIVFMKASTAVQDPDGPIQLPRHLRSDEVDYEGELAVVIGRRCRNVRASDALDYVLGYTCANDVSARDWQARWGGGQWCRGKTFDTFAPLGPVLALAQEIPDPSTLSVQTRVNGEIRQDGQTADMIFSIPELIEFLSGDTTLLPGTVILTGTPHGIGAARTPPVFLQPGDVVTVDIDRIGSLSNPVVEAPMEPVESERAH